MLLHVEHERLPQLFVTENNKTKNKQKKTRTKAQYLSKYVSQTILFYCFSQDHDRLSCKSNGKKNKQTSQTSWKLNAARLPKGSNNSAFGFMIFLPLLLLIYDELMYSLTLSHRKEINKKLQKWVNLVLILSRLSTYLYLITEFIECHFRNILRLPLSAFLGQSNTPFHYWVTKKSLNKWLACYGVIVRDENSTDKPNQAIKIRMLQLK